MEKNLISIIVPVYKVEKYLDKCVESIVSQTYKNLEIILVDDGSPDNCPEMCNEWAKKDDRIKVIHKENGGLSDARNAGIDIANGKYIGFVDSDDYIMPNMFEKLYNTIRKNNADISLCSFIAVDEKGEKITDAEKMENQVLTGEQTMKNLVEGASVLFVIVWNKLYKREIFDDIRFEKGRLHEDEFAIHHILGKAKNIACINDGLYLYLQRNNSITGGKEKIQHLDYIIAQVDRYYFVKQNFPKLAKKQAIKVYAVVVSALRRAPFKKLPKDYQALVDEALKVLYKEKDLRYLKLLLKK